MGRPRRAKKPLLEGGPRRAWLDPLVSDADRSQPLRAVGAQLRQRRQLLRRQRAGGQAARQPAPYGSKLNQGTAEHVIHVSPFVPRETAICGPPQLTQVCLSQGEPSIRQYGWDSLGFPQARKSIPSQNVWLQGDTRPVAWPAFRGCPVFAFTHYLTIWGR